jgi:membrane associated rhomboid family serine protease
VNDHPPSASSAQETDGAVEVYRTHWRPDCEERAFMLHAVGIASQVIPAGDQWRLLVATGDASAAVRQLRVYERENPRRRQAATSAEPLQPYAWLGASMYVLVLLAVAYLAGAKSFGSDWLDAGTLHGALLAGGEPWRVITALTLHFDVAHLLGNLGFGAFFGWLASQLLGPGVAFGTAVLTAAIANLVNGAVQDEYYVSGGASTVVFALLGLLAAYAWRRRAGAGERWAYRWAPLVAGVFLLAFMGVGGDRTDVAAHLGGFVAGAIGGWLLAMRSRTPGAWVQWGAGIVTLGAILAAWALALQA